MAFIVARNAKNASLPQLFRRHAELVRQATGGPAEQRNPLQLRLVLATHEPAPLQTFCWTIEALVASQAGVELQTVVAPYLRQAPEPLQLPV